MVANVQVVASSKTSNTTPSQLTFDLLTDSLSRFIVSLRGGVGLLRSIIRVRSALLDISVSEPASKDGIVVAALSTSAVKAAVQMIIKSVNVNIYHQETIRL